MEEKDILDEELEIPREIGNGDVEMLSCDIYAYEVACIRIEPEGVRPTASAGAHLAFLDEETVAYQFGNQLGDGGDTERKVFTEVCDAAVSVPYAGFDYSFLGARHKTCK